MAFKIDELGDSVLLADGAWGTQLHQMGLSRGECPEVWNVDHPDRIHRLVRRYIEAGSQVVLTNTFGGNPFRLRGHNQEERISLLNREGVRVVKEAAGMDARVFASIGPTGEMLMMGNVSADEVLEGFRVQAEAVAEGGADGIAIEAMSELEELRLALKAAKDCTDLPVVACMSFDSGPDSMSTMMGVTPEQAAEKLNDLGADIVGANCGAGIETYVKICSRLRSATDSPLWIKPNNGLPELVNGDVVYRQTIEGFASHVQALVDAGANIIGGCCGTTPEHIRAMKAVLS